nr:response regulator transcription factor [Amycolatopsis anabasis]
MEHVTTLVVDDQPLIRYAVRALLETSDDIRAVTEAATEQEALLVCEKFNPNIVITELSICGSSAGTAICRFAKMNLDRTAVIVFTADSSPEAVASALNAGADSFVHKSASGGQLVDAVRRTRAGNRAWLLGDAGRSSVAGPPSPAGTSMTRREEEILALVLCRWSNEEIAQELFLAHQTVKNYVSRVLQKLGFNSRRELFRSLDLKKGVGLVPPPRAGRLDWDRPRVDAH